MARLDSSRSTSRSESLLPSMRVDEPMLDGGHAPQRRQAVGRSAPCTFEFVDPGDQAQDLRGDLEGVVRNINQ